MIVAPANIPDYQLFRETIRAIAVKRPRPAPYYRQNLCLDKGYDFTEVELMAERFRFDLHLRKKREKSKAMGPKKKPRRWVVERTQSWINRKRSILIRWAKKPKNYEAMLHLAAAEIAFRAAKQKYRLKA